MTKISFIDLSFRLLALLMLSARVMYWTVTEQQANRNKPRLKTRTLGSFLKRSASLALVALMAVQLTGFVDLWPFTLTLPIQIFGFVLAVAGFAISMSARYTLGANWAHAAEYQIKAKHELVTTGIYRYSRHPIYAGLLLSVVGTELVVGSWLAAVLFVVLATLARFQTREEEAILAEQFGEQYTAYMKRTARFIPGLW